MSFVLDWTPRGRADFDALEIAARGSQSNASKALGLFKQVIKATKLLASNPKHPGLNSHEFSSLAHPFTAGGKVWESYVQNHTPGAYRIFWCYGPGKGHITVIAITPHP